MPRVARLFRGKPVNVSFDEGIREADRRVFIARLAGLVGGISDRDGSEAELLGAIPIQASEFLLTARVIVVTEEAIEIAFSRQ